MEFGGRRRGAARARGGRPAAPRGRRRGWPPRCRRRWRRGRRGGRPGPPRWSRPPSPPRAPGRPGRRRAGPRAGVGRQAERSPALPDGQARLQHRAGQQPAGEVVAGGAEPPVGDLGVGDQQVAGTGHHLATALLEAAGGAALAVHDEHVPDAARDLRPVADRGVRVAADVEPHDRAEQAGLEPAAEPVGRRAVGLGPHAERRLERLTPERELLAPRNALRRHDPALHGRPLPDELPAAALYGMRPAGRRARNLGIAGSGVRARGRDGRDGRPPLSSPPARSPALS